MMIRAPIGHKHCYPQLGLIPGAARTLKTSYGALKRPYVLTKASDPENETLSTRNTKSALDSLDSMLGSSDGASSGVLY